MKKEGKMEKGIEHVRRIEYKSKSSQCHLSTLNLTRGQIPQERIYIQGIHYPGVEKTSKSSILRNIFTRTVGRQKKNV